MWQEEVVWQTPGGWTLPRMSTVLPLSCRKTIFFKATGKSVKTLSEVFTFRVQSTGGIQVEVPVEEGDKVRGHRNPSDWRNRTPSSVTARVTRSSSSFCLTTKMFQSCAEHLKRKHKDAVDTVGQLSLLPLGWWVPLRSAMAHVCCQPPIWVTPTPMTSHAHPTWR